MIPQKMGSRTSPGGRRFYVNHFKCWTLQFGIASCFCCTTLAVGTSWKVIHILALKLSESDSSRPPPKKNTGSWVYSRPFVYSLGWLLRMGLISGTLYYGFLLEISAKKVFCGRVSVWIKRQEFFIAQKNNNVKSQNDIHTVHTHRLNFGHFHNLRLLIIIYDYY